ncbi:MAG: aldehyde dehydrogenase family protein [Actinobacteria bacterium]|nr:aldehyde dehydrogenase family protein [Actinomycetota bacterium]
MSKRDHLIWIDAQEVAAADGSTFEVENPATGEVAFEVAHGKTADIDRAVAAARRAADEGPWPQMHPRERGPILRRAAELLRARRSELADVEVRSTGRPMREMHQQVGRTADWLDFFASVAETHEDRVVPAIGNLLNYVRRVPVGVVGQITPWNHPLLITMKKVAPALAAGNTIVVKPSEVAPVAPIELGRLLNEAGVPPGVVNVVPGFGAEAGKALSEHRGIDKLDLTGGTETGRHIAAAGGRNLIPVQAELGGKAPVLVFEDVPIASAVAGATFATFVASGQSCIAGARLLVQRTRYEELLRALIDRVSSIRVGDPMDPDTQMGPLASKQQLARVMELVTSARDEGATILCGGDRLGGDIFDNGYFFAPTLIADVRQDMRIMREEVFGPVLTVQSFEDEDEAVELANDSDFGLGAAVWTNDLKRGHLVAQRIRSGSVWINDHHRVDPASPWGGFKDSGVGSENGVVAYNDYTIQQSILVNLDRGSFDWFAPEARDLRYS